MEFKFGQFKNSTFFIKNIQFFCLHILVKSAVTGSYLWITDWNLLLQLTFLFIFFSKLYLFFLDDFYKILYSIKNKNQAPICV